MPAANEIRENVTNQILEALQNGVAPWRRPWSTNPCSGSPKNISGRSYSGVNPLLLTLASMKYGFTSRYWGTFNQWRAIGCCVKSRPKSVSSGKWGTTVCFSKPCQKKGKDGEEIDGVFWVLRSSIELLEKIGVAPSDFLDRHVVGDFGDVCEEDKALNDEAIRHGERILSSYTLADNSKLWIITEADRSSTCLLLPSEY